MIYCNGYSLESEISMIRALFKLFGTVVNGAANVMAGTAMLATAGIMAAQEKAEIKRLEKELEVSKMVLMHKDSRVTIGKYMILDIENGFRVLAGTDDFDEAIEWVTEYRLNGRKVKIQREDLK